MKEYVDHLTNTTKQIVKRSNKRFTLTINAAQKTKADKSNVKYNVNTNPITMQGVYKQCVWQKKCHHDNGIQWKEEEIVTKENEHKYDSNNYRKRYVEKIHRINCSNMKFSVGLACNDRIAGIQVPPVPTNNHKSISKNHLRNKIVIGISTKIDLYYFPETAKETQFVFKVDVTSLVYIYI